MLFIVNKQYLLVIDVIPKIHQDLTNFYKLFALKFAAFKNQNVCRISFPIEVRAGGLEIFDVIFPI